jgi:WhiB family redox-sensing transcriptional regulator
VTAASASRALDLAITRRAQTPPDHPAEVAWRDLALCAQTDPEIFFPGKGESATPAKRVCAACPVQTQCLAAGLARSERFGVWGGATERDRRRLGRSQGVAA